jgi:hypothetical protein
VRRADFSKPIAPPALPENDAMLVSAHRLVGVVSTLKNVNAFTLIK